MSSPEILTTIFIPYLQEIWTKVVEYIQEKKTYSMKKIFSLLLLFFPLLGFGQVEFNGIRVGETFEITSKKLQEKGFVKKLDQGNVVGWEGVFSGKTGKVYTVTTPNSGFVWKLVVIPETHTSWSSAKLAVQKYVQILSQKYGEVKDGFYYFKSPYEEGDGHEMLALKSDKWVCFYTWEISGATIALELTSHKYGEAQIQISYEDGETTKINREEKSKIDQNTF